MVDDTTWISSRLLHCEDAISVETVAEMLFRGLLMQVVCQQKVSLPLLEG